MFARSPDGLVGDRSAAAIGSSFFFLVAPGVVAGLIPWWITRWRVDVDHPWWITRWRVDVDHPWPMQAAGAVLLIAGAFVLVSAFVRFVTEGIGTPAPVAPTGRLVVGGLYRFVRNPMYLAVLAAIAGQALLFGQPTLLLYGAAVAVAFVVFVRFYEEPTLQRTFGDEYEEYRRAVPGWWPRLHPWTPGGGPPS